MKQGTKPSPQHVKNEKDKNGKEIHEENSVSAVQGKVSEEEQSGEAVDGQVAKPIHPVPLPLGIVHQEPIDQGNEQVEGQ